MSAHGHWRPDSLFEDVIYGIRHDAFTKPKHRAALRNFRAGRRDAEVERLIRSPVHALRVKEVMGELNPFRASRLTDGDLVIGSDLSGGTVGLCEQWLNEHLLLIGSSGSGKSVLLCLLILQLFARGRRVFVTDFYKRQLRNLLPFARRASQPLVILTPGAWKYNVLQSGRGDPAGHLSLVVDLLQRVLGLPPRAGSIIRQICYELYRRYGIFEGRRQHFPTLFDLWESVKAATGINAAAREAILDRLGAALVSLGRQAAYRLGWDVDDMAAHSIVFEMLGFSEQVKSLLLQSCFFSLLHRDLERGAVNKPLQQLLILDDAQRFVSGPGEQHGGDLLPMDEIAGIIRGCGRGIAISAQSLYGIPERLRANLSTKLIGRLNSGEDYARAAAGLGLSPQQSEWMKVHLKPGTFITQVSSGNCRAPVVVQVPHLQVPSAVDDFQVEQSVRVLDALTTVPAEEFAHWSPVPVIDLRVDVGEVGSDSHDTTASVDAPSRLDERQVTFLRAVIDHPNQPSGNYAKLAGMSAARARAVRERLVAEGYLREHRLATGRRGREAIVLEPLERAHVAVRGAKATRDGGER